MFFYLIRDAAIEEVPRVTGNHQCLIMTATIITQLRNLVSQKDQTHVQFLKATNRSRREREREIRMAMAASVVMTSLTLKPSFSPFTAKKTAAVRGLPSLPRTSRLRVVASAKKKIKTDKPYGKVLYLSGINGGMSLEGGLDASGRKGKGKGVYQFVDKYGANVDGYSPIYNTDDWSPSGDVYTGGTTGLAIWAVTLLGILAGGALLVYNTSALAQ
ncbi:hypothetical protein RHMOL_Rhmol06G0319800 [Rhododendron molle]|uniref:Uncharacterized protein n=1 Tax=Rhododendron molle TaxID=49168 RepID=A0ACC0NIU5_RHOML|nr:hypothetical protein RHMOL_Rhmol06G0319800 [Rhododendron molle]